MDGDQLAKKLLVITTGGTIEKTYDEFDGSLENRGPQIKESILGRLRLPYTDLQVHSIMSKDSLHMDDNDREILYQTIKGHLRSSIPIVVLHGTDTMELSAKYCFDRFQDLSVPIVFSGAMRPLGFEDSDAPQNVTEALYAAKILGPGIFISFHNHLFKVPGVRKNIEKGTFEYAKP